MDLKRSTRSSSSIRGSSCEPVSRWDLLAVDRRWSMGGLRHGRLVWHLQKGRIESISPLWYRLLLVVKLPMIGQMIGWILTL